MAQVQETVVAALSGPRMAAIRRVATAEATEAAGNEPVSSTLFRLAHHPLLWISVHTRLAIALGIVFLMTVKPDLGGALLTVGIAAVLGVASAIPLPGRARAQEGPAV